jgi:hypothetical protein
MMKKDQEKLTKEKEKKEDEDRLYKRRAKVA